MDTGFRWYDAGKFTKKFTQFRLDLIGVILFGVILFRKDSYIKFWKADILINANVLDSGTCSELLIHGC
jgi:hypothetical protein